MVGRPTCSPWGTERRLLPQDAGNFRGHDLQDRRVTRAKDIEYAKKWSSEDSYSPGETENEKPTTTSGEEDKRPDSQPSMKLPGEAQPGKETPKSQSDQRGARIRTTRSSQATFLEARRSTRYEVISARDVLC
ncbi:hypothetical protein NDU88_002715 [Pleurodeles waltl]|uniref:Uncharacterized protein n=1 Tax=Pleurodeles waltl TaxID=8319 RepID=A0AAV7MPP5_PLEWA|nr:hypothetical protein NDU88_002715 [Pleurodeles waltl]